METLNRLSPLIVHLIAAARPNFMKVAPLYHALAAESWCNARVVHTGQHYDANMSDAFFADLALPEPAYHLEIGSGSHAEQTGRTMIAYEGVCRTERPGAIVVVGDVNATAACALVGAKLWIPVVHLEAGLRSRDRRMPEEINRLVTDAISDLLWTPSRDADANLIAEGVPADKIDCIGNIMIDSFEMLRSKIAAASTREHLQLSGPFAVVTLHRPSNVDAKGELEPLVDLLRETAARLPVVFPVHPRTRASLESFGLWSGLAGTPGVHALEPQPYTEFLSLVKDAALVLTDSGGIQEETTFLGVPCITRRRSTERPSTVDLGTNVLVGDDLARAREEILRATNGHAKKGTVPPLWDGHCAERIVAIVDAWLAPGRQP